MKLAKERRSVAMDGFDEQFGFQIEASAKAFQILYGQLYSDPIKAIIRELSTNAFDAHIEAGNTSKPFYVHLPNHLEPYFVIRDYGTGLTPLEMKEIYTVIFKSNKTHSNDFTGCLGLGSKSPFSYVDNFVVESFKDGKHYICNAFINDDGVPTMAVMDGNGQDTEEPNGLKITVSVKTADCNNWMTKAAQVYEYFSLQPEVVGQTINVKPPVYAMEGTGWKVREIEYGQDRGARIVMGNVAYNINNLRDDSLEHLETAFLQCPIDIEVNIGAVDIAPSRETLHFNKKTIASIKERMGEIVEEFKKLVDDYFEDCESLWQARCHYNNLYNAFPSTLLDAVDASNLQWQGQKLFTNRWNRNVSFDSQHMIERTYGGKGKRRKCHAVRPENGIKFYINDLKTGGYSRSLTKVEDDDDCQKILLCKFEDKTEQEEFEEAVGILSTDWNFTSSLPKKPRARRNTGIKRGKSAKVCKFTPYAFKATKSWKNATIDIDDGGYYIPLHRYVSTHKEYSVSIEQITTMLQSLKVMGYDIEVYGVRKAVQKKFDKHPKWVNAYEFAARKLSVFLQSFNVSQYIYNRNKYYEIVREMPLDKDFVQHLLPLLSKDSTLGQYLTKVRRMKLSELYWDKCRNLSNTYRVLFRKELEQDVVKTELKQSDEFFEEYPLLDCLNNWEVERLGDVGYQHLAHYINSIESMES